jgi:hypothetical protein
LCRRARYRTRSPSRSPARRQRGARNRRRSIRAASL